MTIQYKFTILFAILTILFAGCSKEKVDEAYFNQKVVQEVQSIYEALNMNEVIEDVLEVGVLSFNNAYLLSKDAQKLFESHEELVTLMQVTNDDFVKKVESNEAIGLIYFLTDSVARNMEKPIELDSSGVEMLQTMLSIIEFWREEVPIHNGIIIENNRFAFVDEYWDYSFEEDFWKETASFFHEENESLEFKSNVARLHQFNMIEMTRADD
ncbi:MAG: hypothetical protein LRY73_09570 [Bacillus sp. (in: Bacteria)]|nr:hypothetical protein [Bacillus sp. (in: firmicutes)]